MSCTLTQEREELPPSLTSPHFCQAFQFAYPPPLLPPGHCGLGTASAAGLRIQTRDFRTHARAAHALPYVQCQSTCAPPAIDIASRTPWHAPFLSGRHGSSFAVKELLHGEATPLQPPRMRDACWPASLPARRVGMHNALPRPAHGRIAWPAHAERACRRRRHEIRACSACS